jgi:hypothetical protein
MLTVSHNHKKGKWHINNISCNINALRYFYESNAFISVNRDSQNNGKLIKKETGFSASISPEND